jgi:hypothetical protein
MPPTQDLNTLMQEADKLGRQASKKTGVAFTSPEVQKPTPINSVSMDTLANPPEPINIPQPKVPTPPSTFVENLNPVIKSGQDGIIRAQTEESQKRDDILDRLLGTEIGSSQDIYNQAFEKAGGTQTLQQLTDASTKLAQLQGKFRTGAQAISGAEGQSKVFEGVQLSELSRQEAVEVGNQALVVQALQGNFDSARQIALDTSNFAIEDRKATLDNLYNQYNAIGTVVANQEAQLIDQERRRLDDLQDSVNGAITSGGASVEEMQQLTSLDVPDDQKQAIAQSIIARTTRQDRALQRAAQSASIAAQNASIAKSNYELELLKNPQTSSTGLTPELQQRIDGMSDGSRKDLVNANDTIMQLDRIKEIIATTDDLTTLTQATELGREFERLAYDVADKMARERTGAVVTEDETKAFKKILGLGAFNKIISDDQEILDNLDNFINKHTQTTSLIDPTGEIRSFLGNNSTTISVEDSYLDSVIPIIGGANDLYSAFGI